jgi:predicted nuclease with TOPRIM domain
MVITIEHVILMVSGLCGIVAYIWKLFHDSTEHQKEIDRSRLDNCEKERDETREEVKQLFGKVNRLEGKMEGIENLSLSVLDKLEGIKKPDDTTKNSGTD